MGPVEQVKNMFKESRMYSTIIYLLATVLSIVSGIVVRCVLGSQKGYL